MDLIINFKNQKKKIKIDTQIHTQKINLLFFILNYPFRNLKNTQTQNPNTQRIENSNPNSNLWVFLGAYVCSQDIIEIFDSLC